MSTLSRRLLRVLRLPPTAWGPLVRVLGTTAAVRVSLGVLPFHVVDRLFQPASGRPRRAGDDPSRVLKIAAWTGRTFLGDRPCLTQAVAARWLLSRRGYETHLLIGGNKADGEFKAHAWLEMDGRVVLGAVEGMDQLRRFQPVRRGTPAPHVAHDAPGTP